MRISDWSSDVCSSDLRETTQTLAPTVENQSDRIRKPALGRPCGDAGAGTAIQSPAARWMLKHVQNDGKRHATDNERLLTADRQPEDRTAALRPNTPADFVGQTAPHNNTTEKAPL